MSQAVPPSQGIKLSTGETIGSWSLDIVDGKRDDSLPPPLPGDHGSSSGAGPSEPAAHSADADSFANRMMENLYYQKMKAKLKAEEKLKAEASGKGKKKEGKPKKAEAPAAPIAIPEATVSDKGGEVSVRAPPPLPARLHARSLRHAQPGSEPTTRRVARTRLTSRPAPCGRGRRASTRPIASGRCSA